MERHVAIPVLLGEDKGAKGVIPRPHSGPRIALLLLTNASWEIRVEQHALI